MDTIFAEATARGKAGVSVIRVSGPEALSAAKRLSGALPPERHARLRTLRSANGLVLDRALVLTFPDTGSFTGEPVVEFHVHGSPAVVAAVLRELGDQPDLRGAEPGEFTRRALENNRLTLTEVEGLSDLVEAETEAQRRQAMRVFSGGLRELAETWRAQLIRASALLEATIDFSDEEDVPEDVTEEVAGLIAVTGEGIAAELERSNLSEQIRSGFEVAIVGPPNAGKSTLLNYLAGREAALVSEIAGTTRDVIEVRMDIDGLPVTFLDTAGLRETEDTVEAMGVDRAVSRAQQADLRVALSMDGSPPRGVTLGPGDFCLKSQRDTSAWLEDGISGRTGASVPELLRKISAELGGRMSGDGMAIRARHRAALAEARAYLDQAAASLRDQAEMPEVCAEQLRLSVRSLDSLVGRVDVEHVLDEIFASFCLGK